MGTMSRIRIMLVLLARVLVRYLTVDLLFLFVWFCVMGGMLEH